MKTETKIGDLNALVAQKSTARALKKAIDAGVKNYAAGPNAARGGWEKETAQEAAGIMAAHLAARTADGAFHKLPRPRREEARATMAAAESWGEIAVGLGGDYSGSVSSVVEWGDQAAADTGTSWGEQYSRKCTYRKTDAMHRVTLCASGAVALRSLPEVAELSRWENLPLISLDGFSGSAVWVVAKNKSIAAVSGWVAWSGDRKTIFHSTESRDHASKGLAKKVAAAKKEAILSAQKSKIERRARLVARICGGLVATVADAKRLGYCEPGILAFQNSTGFGDSVALPDLVKSGNASAVALALAIARKLSTKIALKSA